jgi:hypothetical protein
MKEALKKLLASQAADSYKRNLLGAFLGGCAIVGGVEAPIFYSAHQWAQLTNVLWAAAVPTGMKYAKAKKANRPK